MMLPAITFNVRFVSVSKRVQYTYHHMMFGIKEVGRISAEKFNQFSSSMLQESMGTQ